MKIIQKEYEFDSLIVGPELDELLIAILKCFLQKNNLLFALRRPTLLILITKIQE